MEGTGEFGEKMNAMPKFVVSRTLENPTWNNTTVLSGDLAEDVGKLKKQFEGDILVAGSAQLVQGLLALDLVDELRLMIFPVVLGAGKKLFADAEGHEVGGPRRDEAGRRDGDHHVPPEQRLTRPGSEGRPWGALLVRAETPIPTCGSCRRAWQARRQQASRPQARG